MCQQSDSQVERDDSDDNGEWEIDLTETEEEKRLYPRPAPRGWDHV